MEFKKQLPDSARMNSLFISSITELEEVMKDKTKEPGDKSKLAIQVLGVYQRMKSVENSRMSLTYRIIKDYSGDKEELRKFIKAHDKNLKVIEVK